MAIGILLLALFSLAKLGAWEAGRVQRAPSSVTSTIATVAAAGSANTIAIGTPDGAIAVYRNDRRIALVRGHGATIVSAVFIEDGRALVTLDAAGQTRLTQIDTAQALNAFDLSGALKVLDDGLWRPYGAPIARAVAAQGWSPAANALPVAFASFLLALGLAVSPQVIAFAGSRRT
ncbi:MAG: hypothetical protein M0D54_19795 [Hyphomonadaceae bacterium JAD_PAG50586_4]|nr:MAG: hypothetical protein M0D54_19795 [Hyphomonadaceae bacterium JAD_PAG50586_4]